MVSAFHVRGAYSPEELAYLITQVDPSLGGPRRAGEEPELPDAEPLPEPGLRASGLLHVGGTSLPCQREKGGALATLVFVSDPLKAVFIPVPRPLMGTFAGCFLGSVTCGFSSSKNEPVFSNCKRSFSAFFNTYER